MQTKKTNPGNISEPLKFLSHHFYRKQEKLAEALGVTRNYVNQVITGRKQPSEQFAKAAELLAARIRGANPINISSGTNVPPGYVPVISYARAGADGFDFEDLADQLDQRVRFECPDPNAFALIVQGDSMEPRLRDGDKVIVCPNQEAQNGNLVAARITERGVVVKNYRRAGDDGLTVVLESNNPAYPPLRYHRSELTWLYPIKGFIGNT